MRKRGFSPEHEEAVARRLAALSAEWDAAKSESSVPAIDDAVPAIADAQPASHAPLTQEWPWEPHTQVRGAIIRTDDCDAIALPLTSPPTLPPTPPSPPVAPGPEEVTALRPPGRHASRRVAPSWLERTMESPPKWRLIDRIGLQAAHLTWVAVMAAIALAATSWWLVRAKEQPVLTPVAVQTGSSPDAAPAGDSGAAPVPAPAGSAPSAEATDAAVAEVVVDVAGKVRRPGIVVLAQGSRVIDALEAAGGARRGVDLQSLNLARILVDGEQIVVGSAAAPAAAGTTAGEAPVPGAAPGALINLNTASLTELETLPGVGPVTAAAIVDWRTSHGGFSSVEDLLEVRGIGEVTLEQLAPLVTI